VVIAAVLPWLPIRSSLQQQPGWCLHVAGNLALMEERKEKTEAHYLRALAI